MKAPVHSKPSLVPAIRLTHTLTQDKFLLLRESICYDLPNNLGHPPLEEDAQMS